MLGDISLPRTHSMVPIANLVDDVATRNPTDTGSSPPFVYIDLSAVDQQLKTITGARQLLGADAPSRARQIVRAGDVLVSTVRPNLNGVAVVSGEYDGAIASTGFCVLRPRAGRLDPSFLFHWVRSKPFIEAMIRQATGASYPAISDGIVKKSLMPSPPLSEQRRIAALLDLADTLLAKRREALTQLDEFARAMFAEMFGDPKINPNNWPLRFLSDVCSPRQWPTITSKELKVAGFPVYGANGFIGYYSEYNHANPTVLVTCRGATCGTINISPPNCYVTGNAMSLDDPHSDIIDIYYLAAALEMRGLSDAISGSAQPQITRQSLSPVKILVPPIELQSSYRRRIESVNSTRALYRQASAMSGDLLESLQARAFSGEL